MTIPQKINANTERMWAKVERARKRNQQVLWRVKVGEETITIRRRNGWLGNYTPQRWIKKLIKETPSTDSARLRALDELLAKTRRK